MLTSIGIVVLGFTDMKLKGHKLGAAGSSAHICALPFARDTKPDRLTFVKDTIALLNLGRLGNVATVEILWPLASGLDCVRKRRGLCHPEVVGR